MPIPILVPYVANKFAPMHVPEAQLKTHSKDLAYHSAAFKTSWATPYCTFTGGFNFKMF